jgi:UDP-N-acetylmuramyl pentapeptide phosphotransferase/UDP-N-acetylglucosamine-1-phosphate transferase
VLAAALVLATGVRLTEVSLPLIGTVALGPLAFPVTLLLIVWMSNLFNFMDGMDGLAGGMAVIGFVSMGLIASTRGAFDLVLICGLIAAASGGFLLSNLPPSLLFMGDVGSVSLGFLAGVLVIRVMQQGSVDLWTPTLIFSPFIVDATVVLIRRLWRGARPWEAHREHVYQRLVLSGWTQQKTLRLEYALMIASCSAAIFYAEAKAESTRLAMLVAAVIVYSMLYVAVRRVEDAHGRRCHLEL